MLYQSFLITAFLSQKDPEYYLVKALLEKYHSWNIYKFYQELLKEKSNPRLKGNRKGIIDKGKEFYIPILNTFPTR